MSNNRTNLKCFVILALCVAVLVTLPSAHSVAEGRKTGVLIFPIKTEGVVLSPSVKKSLLQYLGTRLTMEGVFSVMPESQIKMDLGAAKVQSYQECYDTACQIQLGKAVAADKSLSVQVMMVDRECRVIATLFDLVQEMSESGAEAVGGCKQGQIMESLKSVAAQLSGKIVDVPTGGSGGAAAQKSGGESAPNAAKPDQSVTLSASQTSTMGILAITGSPDGALVEIAGPEGFGIGGKQSGALPLKPLKVPAGNYTVKFATKDYDSEEKTVWVYPGATAELSVPLVYAFGQIELTGGPAGTPGKLVCQKGHTLDIALPGAGSKVKLTVPRGECRLKVSKESFGDFDQTFKVEGGKVVNLDAELRLDPSGIKWVSIPGGSFQMGSNDGAGDEKPIHQVTIQPFEMAQTPVTVRQYRKCVEAGACSKADKGWYCYWPKSDREDYPINCVDWDQASAFAKWVGGRLPTEAEWEYVARAGTAAEKDKDAADVVSYVGASWGKASPVGQQLPNVFGLMDLPGYYWEFCQDWYHSSYKGAPSDGSAWESPPGSRRVSRGGLWANIWGGMRPGLSHRRSFTNRAAGESFRPVRSVR